jgi:hypothetical protein
MRVPANKWEVTKYTAPLNSSLEEYAPARFLFMNSKAKYCKVFQVLWTEPGDTGAGDSDDFTAAATRKKDKYGDNGGAAVRRFVIVTSRGGHSICLLVSLLLHYCL